MRKSRYIHIYYIQCVQEKLLRVEPTPNSSLSYQEAKPYSFWEANGNTAQPKPIPEPWPSSCTYVTRTHNTFIRIKRHTNYLFIITLWFTIHPRSEICLHVSQSSLILVAAPVRLFMHALIFSITVERSDNGERENDQWGDDRFDDAPAFSFVSPVHASSQWEREREKGGERETRVVPFLSVKLAFIFPWPSWVARDVLHEKSRKR